MFYAVLAAFAVFAAALDQISKYLVVRFIPYGSHVEALPGIFHLTHFHNTGMAFSMLEGGRWLFLPLTVIALALMVLTVKKKWLTHPVCLWALAAVAGGAVGNLIDRAFLGYVVDMIAVDFMNFAIFNVADCFVVCGAILLAIGVLFFEKDDKKEKSNDIDH